MLREALLPRGLPTLPRCLSSSTGAAFQPVFPRGGVHCPLLNRHMRGDLPAAPAKPGPYCPGPFPICNGPPIAESGTCQAADSSGWQRGGLTTCSRFCSPDTRQENTRFPVYLSHFLPHRATAVHFSAGPVTEFNSAGCRPTLLPGMRHCTCEPKRWRFQFLDGCGQAEAGVPVGPFWSTQT